MKETRLLMGMPITVEVIDDSVTQADIDAIFDFFTSVDKRFSTYKPTSEISQINKGRLKQSQYSEDMQEVFFLANQTYHDTNGYFDMHYNNMIDPSGIVKGWAIQKAAKLLAKKGFTNFYIDAGGDIQVQGKTWRIGIRNPFKREENVKIIEVKNKGIATSGTYIRGQHIYNPFHPDKMLNTIVSMTVIGPNIYEADRFATAAFAMQEKGILFIEKLPGFEGYMIDRKGIATQTSGFHQYVH